MVYTIKNEAMISSKHRVLWKGIMLIWVFGRLWLGIKFTWYGMLSMVQGWCLFIYQNECNKCVIAIKNSQHPVDNSF